MIPGWLRPPLLIVGPTQVAARALVWMAWPISAAQRWIAARRENVDDLVTLGDKIQALADELAGLPPLSAWAFVAAVSAGVVVGPILVLLGVAALALAYSEQAGTRK